MTPKHLYNSFGKRTFTPAQTGYKASEAKVKLDRLAKEGVVKKVNGFYMLTAATLETFAPVVSWWAD